MSYPGKVASLVFLDFEATGLLESRKRPKITEMCMVSCQREELLQKFGTIRVLNKLVLCFRPNKMIDPQASHITGLYNDMLESQSIFDEDSVKMMSLFLSRLPQPVCLLAHNGNGFDYPLLQAELKKISCHFPESVYCADSLDAFREIEEDISSPFQKQSVPVKTPEGQQIPVVPEEAPNIKVRARQVKRKCDSDFDQVPREAKSVRKCLFGTDSKFPDNDDQERDRLDLTGHKPSRCSVKMQADVVSKRNTCDIEAVKKKLSFDLEYEDDSDDDTLKNSSCSIDIEMTDNKSTEDEDLQENGKTFKGSEGTEIERKEKAVEHKTQLDSQGSITDEDFLKAVNRIENQLGESYNAGNEVNIKCTESISIQCIPGNKNSLCSDMLHSPLCASRPSECHTPQASTSLGASEMNTPENSTSGSTTPKKNLSIPSENCLTPMSGLARSTAMCQLGTPLGMNITKPENEISKAACRALFRKGKTSNQNRFAENPFNIVNVKHNQNESNSFSGENSCFAKSESTNFGGVYLLGSKNLPDLIRPTALTNGISNNVNKNMSASSTPLTHLRKKSYKLKDIYMRTFGCDPADSHNAESDCVTLMKLVKYHSPQFIQWIDEHAVLLTSIEPGY